MAIQTGDYGAVLTGGVGHSGGTIAGYYETLTFGNWEESSLNDFPFSGVEILYPIKNWFENDLQTIDLDTNAVKVTQINSTSVRTQFCEITFRIRNTSFKTWFDFIETNFLETKYFGYSGVQPFFSNDEEHQIKIVSYSSPKRVDIKRWEMTLTLRKA